jgi:hypothetical protein
MSMISKSLLSVALILTLLFVLPSPIQAFSSSAGQSPFPATHPDSIINVKNQFLAGYGAIGPNDSVTNVTGSWIQPKVTCQHDSSTIYAAGFSVGIDGFNGKDEEIVGTAGGCEYDVTEYLAFYAFIPTTSENAFNIKITPGDKIYASVSYSSSTGNFTAYIKDLTAKESASATGPVSGAQRYAVQAGVISAPNTSGKCCLPLIEFAKASFGMDHTHLSATCYATISGTTLPIGSFNEVVKLVMTNVKGTKIRATPSALSRDNSSFTVTWKSAGP